MRRRGAASNLREAMVARELDNREFWAAHFGTEECAVVARKDELIERWRRGDPIELEAWRLPDHARGGLHPSTRVVVAADGSVEIAQSHTPVLSIVAGRPS